ncbi:hypothetical protein SNE40_022604 [Patella caerulea]|uniref:Uncharacterized protein n=1 Tax=Patella caerulea TaxID=87958 RepID=A0AAN8IXT7_PATCE
MAEIAGFSLFAILAILLAGVGCLLHVIGLSVVYWIVSDPFLSGAGSGLWQQCNLFRCYPYRAELIPDYWRATQAFVIIGLLVGVAGLALSILSLIKKAKLIKLLAAIACIVAAGCILLAIIIFGAETRLSRSSQWGWGFILCIVSTLLFVPAGILNFLEFRHSS